MEPIGAPRGERMLALAVGTPGVLLAVAVVVTAVLVAAGRIGALNDPHLTVAEAAALEDSAEIVRLLSRGADPRQPARIRPGILRESPMVMTPLEAATVQGHADVVDLLVRQGATIDAANFAGLWCLAQQRQDADVSRVLLQHAPGPPPADCSHVRTSLDEQ